MTDHGIALMSAGEFLLRLVGEFPDKVLAAHQGTMRYSPKPEAEVLATLESIIGKDAADAVRRLVRPQSEAP
jgi:hypothetical protein